MARAFRSLRRQGDFSRLHRRGKRFVAVFFSLYATRHAGNRQIPRIGVSVSKAVGKAVRRNLVRRRVQCAFDALGLQTYERMDLLFVAKPGAAEASYDRLAGDLAVAVGALRRMI